MKKLTIALTILFSLTANNAFANGGKIPDPGRSAVYVASNGGKIPDPTEEDNGGKIPDPTEEDNGGKIPDPSGRVIAKDSGYPTLMALLSKYFSF